MIRRVSMLSLLLSITATHQNSAFAGTGLMSLYQQASAIDAKLSQAQAQFLADRELLTQAKSLLLPNVSAQASYQQTDYSEKNIPMAAKTAQQQKLQISQSVYDAAAWARFEQAKGLVEQSALSLKLSEQDLLLRLTQAYFDVLRSEQMLALAQSQQQATEKQRDKISEGVRVGLTNPVDLLEIQARYDLSVSDALNAENQLVIAHEALSRLIGIDPPVLKRLSTDTKLPALTEKPDVLAEKYFHQNLQVQANEQKLRVSELDVEAQRAGHLPTVSLQANLANTDNALMIGSNLAYQSNSIALQFNAPIYAGGMVDSKILQSEHLRTTARHGLRYAQEQSRLDILTLAKTVQFSQSRLLALRQAVKSGESFLNAAEEGNRVGMKDLVDVLNARTQSLKARQDLANALYDDVMNRFRLKAAQGSLSTEDLASIEAYLVDTP